MQRFSFETEAQRRRAVALVVSLTANTRLAPQRYERELLTRFERGDLSIDEMADLLDAAVHQVLYHSRATASLGEADLTALLDWSRGFNAEQGITGLLLYSDGRFVQVLEGDENAVSDLYARIRRDTRHTQVVTVSEGPGPRRFATWSMGFGHVTPPGLEVALAAVQDHAPPRELIANPLLQALLRAFT